ncbi:MAG: hypothetical protein ABIP13_01280, partial [Tepidiformaceae bacterium]
VSRIACALGDRVAAVASLSGLAAPVEPCHGSSAIIAFHGTADDVVPFNGGAVRLIYQYGGVRAAISAWSTLNRCSGSPVAQRISTRTVRESHQGCVRPVALIQITGGGHEWPSSSDVNVADTVWAFFREQHLP